MGNPFKKLKGKNHGVTLDNLVIINMSIRVTNFKISTFSITTTKDITLIYSRNRGYNNYKGNYMYFISSSGKLYFLL